MSVLIEAKVFQTRWESEVAVSLGVNRVLRPLNDVISNRATAWQWLRADKIVHSARDSAHINRFGHITPARGERLIGRPVRIQPNRHKSVVPRILPGTLPKH